MWRSATSNFLPPFLPLKRWPELEIRAFGDLNGDTHPDVIWQHTTTGQHAVWLFSGTTLLPNGTVYIDGNPDPTATSYVEPDLNWKIMAAADMDQEGQTDLVWQHASLGSRAMERPGSIALGSVRAVTNASGATVRTHAYHPFGEGVGGDSTTDPMRFTGKPRDGETGLDYFGARYFTPRTGRFTAVDPVMNIEAASVDPQRWNRYAYALNSPTRYIDPDGREVVLALNHSMLQQAKEFREAVSRRLGGGLIARAVDTLIAPFVPATPREVADQMLASFAPVAMAAGSTATLARAFGFTEFIESGSLVGGSLRNGATAMVSFTSQGNTLAVNISAVGGPSGALAALEAGAIRAATTQGATTLKLLATNASDAMARLLRAQGFVRQGESAVWVKEILIKK